jgi:hypothetical protein
MKELFFCSLTFLKFAYLQTASSVYTMAYLDFKTFGGKFKAVAKPVRNIPGHFMNLLHKKHVRLLSHYLPEQPLAPDMLKQWQVSEPEYMYICMYVYMYACM